MVAARQSIDEALFVVDTATVALTGPRASGNTLVLTAIVPSTKTIDNISQANVTWQKAGEQLRGDSTFRVEIWYAHMAASAGTNVVVVLDQAVTGGGVQIMEYSGVATSSALDVVFGADFENSAGGFPNLKGTSLDITDQADELWIWAIGASDAANAYNTPHLAFDSIQKLTLSNAVLESFEMTKDIRQKAQGKLRRTAGTGNEAMLIATFRAATPLASSPVRLQEKTFSLNGAGSFKISVDDPLTTGSLLVAFASLHRDTQINSITQTGVTWVQALEHLAGPVDDTGVHIEVWFGTVATGPIGTLVVAVDASTQMGFVVHEYLGLTVNTTAAIDRTQTNDGTTSTASTGTTLATTSADELLIAIVGARSGGNPSAMSEPTNNFGLADLIDGGGAAGTAHQVAALDFGADSIATYETALTLDAAQQWAAAILTLTMIPDSTVAPSVSAQSPAPDSIGLNRSTDIDFHVGGTDGAASASINVDIRIGGPSGGPTIAAIAAGVGQIPYDGSGTSVSASGDGFDVSIDYRGIFPKGTLIEVRINADNTFGVPMAAVNYSFVTNSDEILGIGLVQIAEG